MKYIHLTSKEFEIMKIFWKLDKPLTASEVENFSEVKTWSLNSLYPLLNNLLKKGFLQVVGNVRSVKAPTRIFSYKISALDYSNMQLLSIFDTSNKKLDLNNLLSYFNNNYNKDEDIIKDIEEWVSINKRN